MDQLRPDFDTYKSKNLLSCGVCTPQKICFGYDLSIPLYRPGTLERLVRFIYHQRGKLNPSFLFFFLPFYALSSVLNHFVILKLYV